MVQLPALAEPGHRRRANPQLAGHRTPLDLFCDRTELASGDRSEATSVNAAKLAGSLFSAAIVRWCTRSARAGLTSASSRQKRSYCCARRSE